MKARAVRFMGLSGVPRKGKVRRWRGGFLGIGRALKKFLGLDYSAPVMMNVAPAPSAPEVAESSENVSNAQMRKRKLLAKATRTELTDASRGVSGKQRTLG